MTSPSHPRVGAARYLRTPLLLLLSLSFAVLGLAAEAAKKNFNVPADDAARALKQFAVQSGEQLLFSPSDVAGVKTLAIKGDLTPRAALEQMLEGTTLVVAQDKSTGALAVRKETATESKNVISRRAKATTANGEVLNTTTTTTGTDSDGVLRLAAFEVLSSKLINADIPRSRDDVQPYVVFDRQQLETTQASDLQDFLRTRLPMNQAPSISGNASNTSSINLRGLGTNQTLVLLDGRRLPPGAASGGATNQADINGIPLRMIERIEVLPSTASGIYGGGATGGVINIITRKDYRGAELSVNYTNPFDTDASTLRVGLNASYEFNRGRTGVTFNYNRTTSTQLTVGDRAYLQTRARQLLLANNPSAFYGSPPPPAGYTTNIINATGGNLVLKSGASLNSSFTSVPVGYAGPSSDGGAALVANAGKYNLDLPDTLQGLRSGLLPAPEQTSFGMNLRQKLGANVEVVLDAARLDNRGSRDLPVSTSENYFLAPNAPNNPFTDPIVVLFPVTNIKTTGSSRSLSDRLLASAVVRLPKDWSASLDYVWSRSLSVSTAPFAVLGDPDGSGPGLSFTSALTSGVLDTLRDLNKYPLDYAPYRLANPFVTSRYELIANEVTLRGSGPVYQLPGGPITLSSSAQFRNEKIPSTVNSSISSTNPTPTYSWDPSVKLDSRAYTSELLVPIFAEEGAASWRRGLQLQFAVRRDESTAKTRATTAAISIASPDGPFPAVNYLEREFSATKATAGFKYSPAKDVALRASAGTGFLAPNLNQLGALTNSALTTTLAITDPKRGNRLSVLTVSFRTGGNPLLTPEESKSVSGGVVFTPHVIPGLRLSLDYTQIKKTNEITALSTSLLMANEDRLPGRVTRAALTPADQALGYTGGVITGIDLSLINVAGKRVGSYDIQADYTWKTKSRGEINFFALGTYEPDFSTKALPTSDYVQAVGGENVIKWRANGGVRWSKGPLSVGWNTQYYGTYLSYSPLASAASRAQQVLNQGAAKIPRQLYHDVQVSYHISPYATGWRKFLGDTKVTLGVQNVFNTLPPTIATTSAFVGAFSPLGDPRLSRYTIDVRKSF